MANDFGGQRGHGRGWFLHGDPFPLNSVAALREIFRRLGHREVFTSMVVDFDDDWSWIVHKPMFRQNPHGCWLSLRRGSWRTCALIWVTSAGPLNDESLTF